MQSVRLKRSGVARHLLEARDFSRVRLHNVLDIVQDEIPVDVIEVDSQLLEL